MIAALIVPERANEETLEEAISRAKSRGLVPCRPARFDPQHPFRVTFIAPECINANWRRPAVAVRPRAGAAIEEPAPCPAA